MITQKAIEKTKFFTTDGTDMWRVTHVKTMTVVDLVNCETGKTGTMRLGEQSSAGFVPVTMPKVKGSGQAAGGEGPPARGERRATSDERPRRTASSQYLGVSVKKTRGGRKRFYAQSTRDGKWKHLGIYNFEEEAAAAVQEYLGNAEEAAGLRRSTERETDREIRQLKEENKVTAWDCRNCGKGYKYKPDQCGKCNGRSFTPARPEK